MTDTTPAHLQDAKTLISEAGFATGDTWYHGTSSGLQASIESLGLKGSGDSDLNKATKKAMTTIGSSFSERKEPIFLTQSKELAFYWAQQRVRARSIHLQAHEEPIVFEVKLSASLHEKVTTDTGAAALLLGHDSDYQDFVSALYETNGLAKLELDPISADRLDFLNKLGMAYYSRNIDKKFIRLLK